MSNEKLKSEEYANLGGINQKASPYALGPGEFLDIINFDFQTPGSLSQRWGSTQYVGQTFSAPPNMLAEFARLDGTSQVIVGTSVGVWAGATTGQMQGLSFSYFGATQPFGDSLVAVPYAPINLVYKAANGDLINQGYNPGYCYLGDINSNVGATLSWTAWGATVNGSRPVVFNNWLYSADGKKVWRYDGTSTYAAQLLPPLVSGWALSYTSNPNALPGIGTSFWMCYYASYVNNRGVEGPIWPIAVIDAESINGTTAVNNGGSFLVPSVNFLTPAAYGISSINIYSYASAASTSPGATAIWGYPYVFMKNVACAAGATDFTTVNLGTTLFGQSVLAGNVGAPSQQTPYIAMGLSLTYGAPNFAGGISAWALGSYSPRYLEIYKNRMFMAGFSSTPSIVWFSDIGEPEGFQADWNFEVRTNDGDYITCLRAYSTRLYVFKKNSMHCLFGDSPNNFSLQEISTTFGCLNNNCAVVYDDILVFLDEKGVIMFNGSNLELISAKIQPIFNTMNYTAALNVACMEHDKIRNQVVLAIPVNGSSTNNLTLVYDYNVGAWTKYDGFQPSIFAAIRGRNNTKNLFYGDNQGRLNWFGSSFLGDNGAGFTTYFKSRFFHELGESTQKQWRRLYANIDVPSVTLSLSVNFFQDFGASVVYSTSMPIAQFQERIDYGISSKAIAFELSALQTNSPLKLHGFTLESRLQRRV